MDSGAFLSLISSDGIKSSDWAVSSIQTIPYPYWDFAKRRASFSIARLFKVHGHRQTHLVCVSVRRNSKNEASYAIWCGDSFLEGRKKLTSTQASERIASALEGAELPNRMKLKAEMSSHYGSQPESDACDFWKNGRKCIHTQHVLGMLTERDLRELAGELSAHLGGGSAVASSGDGHDDDVLLEEFLFRVPVLFEGPRGAGKTFGARRFVHKHGYDLVEVSGHESMEAVELLGYPLRVTDGSFVWKDGGLSQAVRLASKGRKVCLIIDELLRIPQRHLSVLLTALSPDEGKYRVRTGRIVNVTDGVGEEEVLTCPVENLAVVATTNVGCEYAVDAADPALVERFHLVRKETTPEVLEKILTNVVEGRELGDTAEIVRRLLRFYTAAEKLKNAGQIASAPTTRTLVRAVELARSADQVGTMVMNQALQWVARDPDGQPVKEQIESLRKLVSSCFPGMKGKVWV